MRTLKQIEGRKRLDRYPWERPLTTDEKMGRAINRLRFKSRIWEKGSIVGFTAVWEMVNAVRTLSGLDSYSYEMVWDGYQYCRIFHQKYDYALEEFRHLCWGDW